MIETCANFFGLLFLYFFVCLLVEKNTRLKWGGYYLACISIGALCALTKATTFPGFIAGAAFLYILLRVRRQLAVKNVMTHVLLGLVVLVPVFVTFAWTMHSDTIKLHNSVGQSLTSSALWQWNFGDLNQRLGPVWKRIFGRGIRDVLGMQLSFLILVYGFCKIGIKARLVAGAFFILYLIPFLVFTNLYIVHNYYQVASGFFLILSAATIIHALYQEGRLKHSVVILLIVFIVQLGTFADGYYKSTVEVEENHQKTMRISNFIRQATPIQSSILVFGFDWSSEISYYSQRKSFTVPDWISYDKVLSNIDKDKMEIGGLPISAIVDANHTRQAILNEGKYDIFSGYQKIDVEGAKIYYR
jgi:hypothetical protein